jgi:hypothetical protein
MNRSIRRDYYDKEGHFIDDDDVKRKDRVLTHVKSTKAHTL